MSDTSVLLVTKGHPFDRGEFFSMFDHLGVNWTHVEQPAARVFMSPELAEPYDVLVFYDMPGLSFESGGPALERPSEEYKSGLISLLASGKGMVFLHHAIAGWPAWEEYAEIIGGRFLYVPGELRGKIHQDSGYRHGVEHKLTVLQDHPVTAHLPACFPMTDELYLCEVFEDSVTPLLSSDYQFNQDNFYSAAKVVQEGKMYNNEDWQHPAGSSLVGWLKHYLNSPIVYLQGGDDPVAYHSAQYQQLLKNAINWAGSQEALDWAMAQ